MRSAKCSTTSATRTVAMTWETCARSSFRRPHSHQDPYSVSEASHETHTRSLCGHRHRRGRGLQPGAPDRDSATTASATGHPTAAAGPATTPAAAGTAEWIGTPVSESYHAQFG